MDRSHFKLTEKRDGILYAHIPFCEERCGWCRHYSNKCNDQKEKNIYIDHLLKEIDLMFEQFNLDLLDVKAIAMGGGTPMELSLDNWDILLTKFDTLFPRLREIEYTVEMNPKDWRYGDFEKKIELLKSFGMNRVSLGCQAFDDYILEKNGSRHTVNDIEKSVKILRDNNIDNINADLLVGLEMQQTEDILNSIDCCFDLGFDHISIYPLDSHLNSNYRHSKARTMVIKKLRFAGWRQVTAAHFTRDLTKVHLHVPYSFNGYHQVASFGAGAISYFNGMVYRNHRDFDLYYRDIDKSILPMDEDTIKKSHGIINILGFTSNKGDKVE